MSGGAQRSMRALRWVLRREIVVVSEIVAQPTATACVEFEKKKEVEKKNRFRNDVVLVFFLLRS